jgi:isocitrate lyase
MGYKYQFITLAGFHNLSLTTFDLATRLRDERDGRLFVGCSRPSSRRGPRFTATRHQREVGTSYFDAVSLAVSAGRSATTAMEHSTESAQF